MSTASTANWPRVSTILKVLEDSYEGVPPGVLAEAAARGERLHGLCLSYLAFLDALCDEPLPTPLDLAAYTAFTQWVKDSEVQPIAIEQNALCFQHRYQGTPDALVEMGPERTPTLIDLKFTASILRINRVQIQAYRMLEPYRVAKRLILLHIDPTDGQLRAETVKHNNRDWAAFLSARNLLHWRQA